MKPYTLIMLCGCAAALALYVFRVRRASLKLSACLVSLPLMLIFGLAAAKLVYLLCFFDPATLDEYWFEDNILRFTAKEFSVVGGIAGVTLAIVLASRLTHQPTSRHYLDAFAPCGALFLAVLRYAESEQGRLGAGMLLPEGSPLAFYPLAITNDYGEAFLSVFLLEAVTALVCAVWFAFHTYRRPGLRYEYTLVALALTQVFFESLRAICMRWGFVRIEQLMCGIFIFTLIFTHCLRCRCPKPLERFLPAILTLVCIGVIVFVEFALDKFPISDLGCYALMIAALAGMAVLEHISVRRLA